MKNLFSVLKISLLALAAAGTLFSCRPDEKGSGLEVKLAVVQQGVSSVTFNISCENAAKLSYIQVADLSSVPSAEGIMTAGTPVEVPGQDVTLEGLTPSTTYYVAAVAASESGAYSSVATLEIATIGNDCDFNIQILAVSGSAISYMVNPSDTTVPYYVAAVKADSLLMAEPSEIELYNAVVDSVVASAAEAAGLSEADYLSQNLVKGISRGAFENLTPATQYLVVALGLSTDGALTTPVAYTNAATNSSSDDDLRFELGYTDLQATTVTLTLVPTDEEATYCMLCQTQSNYPDLTEEDGALAFAQAAVEVYGMYLDQNIGPYTGTQTVTKFEVNPETKYYYFAFGYVPMLGLNEHSCAMTTFTTPEGEKIENFTAEVEIMSVTAMSLNYRVKPGLQTIYYQSVVVPDSTYNVKDAQDAVYAAIKEHFDTQRAQNPTYTMGDAVQSTCYRGENAEIMIGGLSPLTNYKIVVVPVSDAGSPADNVITFDVTTTEENTSNALLTNELVGIYDGSEAMNKGLFPGATTLGGHSLAVFHLEANADADPSQLYYYIWGGDIVTQPEPDPETGETPEFVYTDDYILSIINGETAIEYGWRVNVDISKDDGYIFCSNLGWYDKEPYTIYYTMCTVAKDRNGVFGKVGRTLFQPVSTEVDDIDELVELVNRIEAGQQSSPLRISERGAARW